MADIAEVLGTDRRVRTQVVLARLAEFNPREYEDWTFSDLRAALAAHGVEPVKSDGVKVVRADDITRSLTHRHQHGGEDDGEEAGT